MLNDRIRELQAEIELEKKKMDKCSHDWYDVEYDPEKTSKGCGGHYEGCGSDPYWVFDGYETINTPRWSRTCKICGKIEYTKQQEVVKTQPKFN